VGTWSYEGKVFGDTERVPCPACGADGGSELLRRPDGLPVVTCDGCGLYFVNPQPTQDALKTFYASGYFHGGHDFFQGHDYFEQRDIGIRDGNITGWADVRALGVEGKKILDLGCASGALLVLARQNGAQRVKGVELDERIAQQGREKYGLDILVGDVASRLALEAERFDIVSAFDLVEHVKEPRKLFEAVAGVLVKGGRFVCSVPNGECLDRLRNDWAGITENMEHLHYLRAPDLRRLAASGGLAVDGLSSRGFPLHLRPYANPQAGRASRWLREPAVSLANAMTKMHARISCRGEGHEIAAVFSKP
jgi:SAM-dependent methyltransferase